MDLRLLLFLLKGQLWVLRWLLQRQALWLLLQILLLLTLLVVLLLLLLSLLQVTLSRHEFVLQVNELSKLSYRQLPLGGNYRLE